MDSEFELMIRAEAEATKDAPLVANGERPNRNGSTVCPVRLTSDEADALQAAADQAGLPPSTLVRSWIVERVKGGDHDAVLRALIRDEVRAAVRETLAL